MQVEKGAVGHGGRPAGMRGWQGQPRKVVEYEHWHKIKRKCRSLGCELQLGGGAENGLLLAIALQNSSTISATPCEQFKVLSALVSALFSPKTKDAVRVSFYFERSCASGTAPLQCIEAPRAPLERALDPGRPRRGPRRSWGRDRGIVASGKLQELSL
jgi:hypothetical protein